MSACYLYAITQGSANHLPALTGDTLGLCDQPLHWVTQDGLAASVSAWGDTYNATAPAANPATVLRHEQVIEAMMAHGPTLPVRFGTILANADQVRQLLAARQAAFTADLAHITGRVEMGVRILWEPPPAANEPPASAMTTPGRRYLQDKARNRQQERAIYAQGEAIAHAVNQALRPLATDVRMRILQTQRLLLSAAYLVPHPCVTDFHTKIAALRQAHPGLALLASGPWPAYHFVSNTESVENQ
ncbi:MAG: GvpL/GvpF family gas vesicle protein [Caldilineaceae bacterium]